MNVGCGKDPLRRDGVVNLDKVPGPGVDVVFDLDHCCPTRVWAAVPLPFADETFQRVEAIDILEHVEDLVAVFQEMLRVAKIGGEIRVRGPACENPEIVWADPTHRRAFARRTFDNFDPTTFDGRMYGHYCGLRTVKVVSVALINKGWDYSMRRAS